MADPDREPDVERNSSGEEEDDRAPQVTRGPTPEQQEAKLRQKYGGLLPRKPPLMQKEERTYFDSADWALNKGSQGGGSKEGSPAVSKEGSPIGSKEGTPAGSKEGSPAGPFHTPLRLKSKAAAEALRPKLQPTPHHPVRRHSFADQARFKP